MVFVTRRFPPSVGGMETFSADVFAALSRRGPVELVALRRSSLVHLAWFLPWALVRTGIEIARCRVDRVVCGDAIVWAAISPLARLKRVDCSVLVMGLDLTFPNRLYQRVVRTTLPNATRVVAISSATASAASVIGVPDHRIRILHPGVRVPEVRHGEHEARRRELVSRFELQPDHLILVSLGRLVRRKGIAWFIEHVIPLLPESIVYLVAGNGPLHEEVVAAAMEAGASDRVRILGRVTDVEREMLLGGADLALMPNIRVRGDMEGFGLVAVEAACCGAIVIASRLEGLADAIVDGETGILVQAEDAAAFAGAITRVATPRGELDRLRLEFQRNAIRRFSLERMSNDMPAALGLVDTRQ